jgi:hypothetical protein
LSLICCASIKIDFARIYLLTLFLCFSLSTLQTDGREKVIRPADSWSCYKTPKAGSCQSSTFTATVGRGGDAAAATNGNGTVPKRTSLGASDSFDTGFAISYQI